MLVLMGGRHAFKKGDEVEWNFAGATERASVCGGEPECGSADNLGRVTNETLEMWPKEDAPIVFLDFETGVDIRTGSVLEAPGQSDSPCREAYAVFCATNIAWCEGAAQDLRINGTVPVAQDRCSWDIMAVIYAVRDTVVGRGVDSQAAGRGSYLLEAGHQIVDPLTGVNTWVASAAPAPFADDAPEASLVLNTSLYSAVRDEIHALLARAPKARAPKARCTDSPLGDETCDDVWRWCCNGVEDFCAYNTASFDAKWPESGIVWPPGEARKIADVCPRTCAASGLHVDGCSDASAAPHVSTAPPPPPSPSPLSSPPPSKAPPPPPSTSPPPHRALPPPPPSPPMPPHPSLPASKKQRRPHTPGHAPGHAARASTPPIASPPPPGPAPQPPTVGNPGPGSPSSGGAGGGGLLVILILCGGAVLLYREYERRERERNLALSDYGGLILSHRKVPRHAAAPLRSPSELSEDQDEYTGLRESDAAATPQRAL